MIEPINTLFLITTYQGSSHIEGYWREAFNISLFSDMFKIVVIDGQEVTYESNFWGDQYFKFGQSKILLDLFSKNKVKSGDIFVITEAFNHLIVPLTLIRHEFNIDVKFVSFWGNSVFNYRKTTKKWGKEFFYSIFNSYDLNCFPTEQHFKLFNWRFGLHQSRRSKHAIVGYPFGYLYDRFNPEIEKDNIVVFPYPLKDEIQQHIFKNFAYDIPEYQFIFAQKDYNRRDLYIDLLDKSKGLFWGGDRIDDPILIFEAMCKGIVPFVPNRTFYYYDFNSYYHYNKQIFEPRRSSNPGLLVVRRRFQLIDFLKEKLYEYDKWKDIVRSDALIMKERYYNNELFKQELCQLI